MVEETDQQIDTAITAVPTCCNVIDGQSLKGLIMNLRDLIYEKGNLEDKLSELREHLQKQPKDELAKMLVEVIDHLQINMINIYKANTQCKLTLSDQEIDLNIAAIIRDCIKMKIDTLTMLIKLDSDLDKLELMQQRDSLLKDYSLLDMSIINTDINTKIG